MNIYDGYFSVEKLNDGYYIHVYPAKEGGRNVKVEEVMNNLKEIGVDEFDMAALVRELSSVPEEKSFKVANLTAAMVDNKPARSELFKVSIPQDNMNVYLTLYPSQTDSYELSVDEVVQHIKNRGIQVDVDTELIYGMIDNKEFNNEYIVARGIPAVDEMPATIEYFFKTEKEFAPEVDEQGNVNYHKLNAIANVMKGQKLAVLHPVVPGVPGMNIYGHEIVRKKAKPVKLKRGKNTIANDDNTEVYASEDGLVKLEDDKIVVNNVFEVPYNVSPSTGDIEFEGSVIVHGNVMTGFKVIARGDVEVMGVVEGAIVEAGGNITLHKGIQGMNRCSVKAGGNLLGRYIENADVVCSGYIHSEAILHSNVSAKEEIIVEGKKGMITGGTVRSGIEIRANILGSHMGTATNIEVGIDPILWEEYNELLKELPKMKEEVLKLDQVIVLLNKRKALEGDLDEAKQSMYVSATRNKIFLTNKINISEKKIEDLKREVDRRNDGRIKVKNTVYPGTRITIGTAKYFVRDEVKYVLMEKNGADVKLMSL